MASRICVIQSVKIPRKVAYPTIWSQTYENGQVKDLITARARAGHVVSLKASLLDPKLRTIVPVEVKKPGNHIGNVTAATDAGKVVQFPQVQAPHKALRRVPRPSPSKKKKKFQTVKFQGSRPTFCRGKISLPSRAP